MNVFNDPNVKEIVSKMSFNYEDLRSKNISMYIKILENDIEVLSPLIRIFLTCIGSNLLIKENKKYEERIYFFLDEFTRFGRMDFLLRLPEVSRSYNLPAYFFTQTEAQIDKVYSPTDTRILSGNCTYKVIFTINDFRTANNLSQEIGNITRTRTSSSHQDNKLFGSKSKSLESYALLTAQDLQNIPKDELIISVLGHKATPIRAKVNYWFKDSVMKKIISKYAN